MKKMSFCSAQEKNPTCFHLYIIHPTKLSDRFLSSSFWRHQSPVPNISSAAMSDIYLIYSLPKLQSTACLLKSAVCCAAWHADKSHIAALWTIPLCQEWPVSIEREEKWKQRSRDNVKYGRREKKSERERERKAQDTFYK